MFQLRRSFGVTIDLEILSIITNTLDIVGNRRLRNCRLHSTSREALPYPERRSHSHWCDLDSMVLDHQAKERSVWPLLPKSPHSDPELCTD